MRPIHSLILAILVSLLNWLIVTTFIIEISVGKYFLVEIMTIVSLKLSVIIENKYITNDRTE